MRYEIVLPKCGVSMEKGSISRWYKKAGDYVKKDEVLFDVETDKVSVPVESAYEGFLNSILVNEGEEVPVGIVTAIITDKSEGPINTAPESSLKNKIVIVDNAESIERKSVEISIINSEDDKSKDIGYAYKDKKVENQVFATPWARKRAKDENINDLAAIKGSGPNGIIVGRDVDRYVHDNNKLNDKPTPNNMKSIPYKGVRKLIGERLKESKNEKPHYYLRSEVDMTQALLLKDKISEDTGCRISLSEILIFIAAKALEKHPYINSSLIEDKIVFSEVINIGVAVGLEDGLIVPVIKDVNRKSLCTISAEVKELIGKAKDKKLIPNDLEGGTFTLSNLGMYEVNEFTAIINKNQSAILAVGKIDEKLYFDENRQVQSRKVMYMTLSCDHRVIDGVIGAKFLKQLKDYIEDPVRILY